MTKDELNKLRLLTESLRNRLNNKKSNYKGFVISKGAYSNYKAVHVKTRCSIGAESLETIKKWIDNYEIIVNK
jgi:hypothetical protein